MQGQREKPVLHACASCAAAMAMPLRREGSKWWEARRASQTTLVSMLLGRQTCTEPCLADRDQHTDALLPDLVCAAVPGRLEDSPLSALQQCCLLCTCQQADGVLALTPQFMKADNPSCW